MPRLASSWLEEYSPPPLEEAHAAQEGLVCLNDPNIDILPSPQSLKIGVPALFPLLHITLIFAECVGIRPMMFVSSSLLVESVVALLSCVILLVLLSTRTPPPPIKRPIKRRTFRISSIPPDVTEGELRSCLKCLLEDCTPDDLIISLVPYSYGKEQMATVTFTRREPSPFSEYKAGERVHVQNEGMKFGITVDCEFQGVTPLYSAKEPTVECVEVSLVRFSQELTMECAVLLLSPGLLDMHSDRGNRAPRTTRCG
jgi:hypothetical protein